MPKGYWIARVDVHDPEAYRAYVAANGPVFRKFGARFLVRGGQSVTPEGIVRERNVVLEFPSYADAVACYESTDYQPVKALRAAASEADIVIIEGYDGPQP
ncbi:MAG: DUF1330 domain-containing protein [Geminicoccaceae bacterium]